MRSYHTKLLLLACMLAVVGKITAQDQIAVPGKAGQAVRAVRIYNSIREAERSPLNIIHKGPIKENLQGLENRDEIEPEVEFPELTPGQIQNTPVYRIPESEMEQHISTPPDPTSDRLAGGQLPSYAFQGNLQNGWIPSDAQAAAGPNHLVLLANGNARIIRKSDGAVVSDVTLDAFFGWSGTFDPRIFYDPYNGRWVALALKGSSGPADSKFRLFISNNSDPTAGWYYYELDVDGANGCWLDFAMLGFNANWIILSGNTPGCGTGINSIYAFNKAQAYSGGSTNFWTWAPVGNLSPALTYDNSQTIEYFVRTYNGNSGGNGYCQLYSMTGAVSSPSLAAGSLVAVNFTWAGNTSAGGTNPRQLGSTVRFDFVTTFGASMHSNCVYRNGSLWWTHPVFLPSTGTTNRTSTLWWQANPASAAVQQVGLIDDGTGTVCTFYPNIAVNSASDAVISYCQFSPNYYQSASYSWHNSGDAAGSLSGGVFYAGGGNINTSTRTGDYGASFVDPLDDNSIWAVNQISSTTADYWNTWGVLIPYKYGCYSGDANFGNNFWYGNTKNEAAGTIYSQEMISGSSIVDYDAGIEVVMQPGFAVFEGAQFHAYINGCDGARMLGGATKGNTIISGNQQLVQSIKSSGYSFQMFPNPAFDRVTLNFVLDENETNPEFLLFDANMKLIKDVELNAGRSGSINTIDIDLSSLSHGIYMCNYKTNTKTEVNKLVIVK